MLNWSKAEDFVVVFDGEYSECYNTVRQKTEDPMRVHPMEVAACLGFTKQEREILSPTFAFGDAEEQLSYPVNQLGSERVATLIVNSKNGDIARLALTEIEDFDEGDRSRLQSLLV
jgi:hypothetical protein